MNAGSILALLVFMPIAGAFVSYSIGRYQETARDYFADLVVAVQFLGALYLFSVFDKTVPLSCDIPYFAGFGLHFVLDGFRSVYVLVAAFMWLMTTVFSKEYFTHYRNRNRYYLFLLLTYGATLGVFLAADLYTAFVFFEVMSFTSYVWVAHDENKAALRAAQTYLAVAVISGMVMLMGLFLLYHTLGTLRIDMLLQQAAGCADKRLLYVAGGCISVGFGAKAGAFPLHIWLPKAHPAAPAPASALLSGILTKAGIFGLLVISCNLFYANDSWGGVMLLIGMATLFLGALLALFSVDIKRTLACSSISQIGFILAGIGMQGLLGAENAVAARGTLLHMVNHSLIKLVLFMAAGVIFMNVHKLDLNEIRGFGRKKPLLHFIFLMGALGIGGIPLWNGYISKTLLHESIVEYMTLLQEGHLRAGLFFGADMKLMEWIFLISGGITIAYMAKLYIAVFVEKNEDAKEQERFDAMKRYMNPVSAAALTISAAALPLMGCIPHTVMDFIADRGTDLMHTGTLTEQILYFSAESLKGAAVSITAGVLLYLVVVRLLLMKKAAHTGQKRYANRWPRRLDLENSVYRPLLVALGVICGFFCRVMDSMADAVVVALRKTVYRDKPLPFELTEGTMFTYHLGSFLDYVEEKIEKRFPNWKHRHHDFVHELAIANMEWRENKVVITRTLSFGLLLFCIGFILTAIYLLRVYW